MEDLKIIKENGFQSQRSMMLFLNNLEIHPIRHSFMAASSLMMGSLLLQEVAMGTIVSEYSEQTTANLYVISMNYQSQCLVLIVAKQKINLLLVLQIHL